MFFFRDFRRDVVAMRLALLLLAACSLQAVQALQPLLLDLRADGAEVTATAECGVASDGSASSAEYVVCIGEPQCVRRCGGEGIAHGAELAVDGDRNTSWQSPPLSFYQERGETIGDHNLTIDLGRVRRHLPSVLCICKLAPHCRQCTWWRWWCGVGRVSSQPAWSSTAPWKGQSSLC